MHTKQTAGYFQSQSAHNHLRGNLIYNGPRKSDAPNLCTHVLHTLDSKSIVRLGCQLE